MYYYLNILKTLTRYFRFLSISAFIFTPIFPLAMFAVSKLIPTADVDMQAYLLKALMIFCAGIVNGVLYYACSRYVSKKEIRENAS